MRRYCRTRGGRQGHQDQIPCSRPEYSAGRKVYGAHPEALRWQRRAPSRTSKDSLDPKLVDAVLTSALRPPPGFPARRASPGSCARKFVALVKYVTKLCPPVTTTSRTPLA